MHKAAAIAASAVLLASPLTAQVVTTEMPQATGYSDSFDAARAQRNYEAVLAGQKTLDQLSPQEFAEVRALDNAARGRAALRSDKRSPRQKCLDEEIKRAGGSPSRLELSSIELKCSQR